MSKRVVEVEGLSKRYFLHRNKGGNDSLRDLFTHCFDKAKKWIASPSFKKIKSRKSHLEEFWALRDLSFAIEEGDCFAIIGRNGAGKSTLLKILSRIVTPTAGKVQLQGRVASLLEVGTGFHPELTGRENIFLNGAILGMEKKEIVAKFDQIVAFAEIERFVDTPVKRFSSGMHARLGFAIAAHLNPDILIVDEVLAVGDASFQEKCLKKMSSLGKEGRTIIFVSHDISAVLTLCKNGLLLDKGQAVFCGAIEQCANHYVKRSQESSFCWDGCLGDESVRLYRVGLEAVEQERTFFFQGEKARLLFEYEVLKATADLYFTIEIRSLDYALLARTQTSDDADRSAHFTEKGRHKASFEIDTSLFHEGEYLICFQCTIHNSHVVIADDIVLKLVVYASRKQTHATTLSQRRAGLFLGHHWQKVLQ